MTRPSDQDHAQKDPVDTQPEQAVQDGKANAIAGISTAEGTTRTGDDSRKRGWFWHWNAIVTQFAPLVGLKGVGLLNSYTVWTDRRAESPHRGYAFPSQQSEADFYGEERSELITINKILVALDLIEIRKEMVLRADEAGRRWRVPHNFYRVKDRDDGFSLTADAVYRVVELADQDRNVYRYVRHIFSPKFSPIDSNSVWTEILENLRERPVWIKLAAKALREEERNSERSRAGHRSRKAGKKQDAPTPITTVNDTPAVESVAPGSTSVAFSNKGSNPDVARSNNGLDENSPTIVPPTNEADPTDVEQSNRTYNQRETTTTTTDVKPENELGDATLPAINSWGDGGPGDRSAPANAAGESRGLQAFVEANDRPPSLAERKLLRELADRFEPVALEQGITERKTGWSWVEAAIYEAVASGSTFVAPRRIREILLRWERDGFPDPNAPRKRKSQDRKGKSRPPSSKMGSVPAFRAERTRATPEGEPSPLPHSVRDTKSFPVPEVGLPSDLFWSAVLDEVSRNGQVGRANFEAWLRPTTLVGRSETGGFVVATPNEHSVKRIEDRFRTALLTSVSRLTGQELPIDVVNIRTWQSSDGDIVPADEPPAELSGT